jgi:predicted CoA-binding protein
VTSKIDIQDFITQPKLALIGVSRSGSKFSNATQSELISKGYTVYAVNRSGGTVNGQTIYTSLAELPEPVDTVLVMVKAENAAEAARECVQAGVKRVWFQQGGDSAEALKISRESGMKTVSGECILMYAGKAGFHKFHRFFRELLGKKLN